MTTYASFEELEANVPLSQLCPSLAFARCAAQLPHDVDQLHGDVLVDSLQKALTIHSKARVVLQCWVLLIMRRRVDARHEKDALYDRLQQTAVSPQERVRYRRGAMLLCHLLVEREVSEANSLLDRYLVDFYFPWSAAVNDRDDAFYLQADVIHWVRQALDFVQVHGTKITATKWMGRGQPTHPPSPSTLSPMLSTPAAQSLEAALVETIPLPRPRRCTGNDRTPQPGHPASPSSSPSSALSTPRKRRRRSGAAAGSVHTWRELQTMKKTIKRWARRLHGQLLQAARMGDNVQILRIADELQVPPFVGGAGLGVAAAHTTDEDELEDDAGDDSDASETSPKRRRVRCDSTVEDDSRSHPSSASECTVCAEEPKHVEEVWNVSCGHGFCSDCMLARLSQRERRCMCCRAQLLQLVDRSGKVFQHYEWTKWCREQHQRALGARVLSQ